jgi:hypothetical protein
MQGLNHFALGWGVHYCMILAIVERWLFCLFGKRIERSGSLLIIETSA